MPLQPSTTAHLDHLLATAQRDGRLPSVAAGLVRGGELVWSGAAGTLDGRADGRPADADTQYRMGSITKTFVGVCVLRLRDAGRLELTDRFGAHVPGSGLDDVTIEQLLTHAAGTQAETSARGGSERPAAAGTSSSRRRPSGSASGPDDASTTPTWATPRWAASSRWPTAARGSTSCATTCSSRSA